MPFEEVVANPVRNAQQNEVSLAGELNASLPQTVLHLGSGRAVVLPTELLLHGVAAQTAGSADREATVSRSNDALTIPVVQEEMFVTKKTVTTGTVRLHKSSETFTDSVSLPITHTGWEVERRKMDQLFTEPPQVRQEGDVTVYPLVEERLVARREYFLIEEVRVRRVETTSERTATAELKRDVLTVERDGAGPGGS